MDGAKVASVLIVDDDLALVNLFAQGFEQRGWRVTAAESCVRALLMAKRARPQLIVLDLLLRDGTSLDIIGSLRAEVPTARIVVMTGHASLDTAIEAMRSGAFNYVVKPCGVDALIAAAQAKPQTRTVPSYASLAQSERVHINRVMAACEGNISEAARRLGMHRRSLQRKLRKNVPALPEQ
jgi:two-component system response regulator RegA